MTKEIELRRVLPEVAKQTVQLAVDNPGQVALMAASTIVVTRIALRAMRPRNLLEAAALAIVLDAGLVFAAKAVIDHRILNFKIRDSEGKLIPLQAD